MEIVIIGAGNAGKATAAYLLSMRQPSFNDKTDDMHDSSYKVRLITGDAKKAAETEKNGLTASGRITGNFRPMIEYSPYGTGDIRASKADVIIVQTVAGAHRDVAERLKGHLGKNQLIIIFNGNWGAAEFESVLGIRGIDEYIRYSGTMSLGGVHYNEASTFATKERADEYVDTAIARNIQHSLRCYQHEGHFRHLQDLYEAGELTSAINRVVEDINHRFTLEVLTRDFQSSDLSISANNLRRDRTHPTDILDRVDVAAVTESLRALLEIRNKGEQTVPLDKVHAAEIKEYLDLLDLTQDIEVLHLPHVGEKGARTVIAQPGLRYAQAAALIQSLLLDETFSSLSLPERNAVQGRILSEIMGRMMEDIVLLETKLANPDKQVFVLQFPVGEFDMVVFDPATASCEIFEIKHSTEVVPAQYRHLVDPQKCAETEHRFGPIMAKTVLYRGESQIVDGVKYENVESYLRKLGKPI